MSYLLAVAQLALAAPDGVIPFKPREIIVTGERIARPSQETPSSLAIFKSDDLDDAGTPEQIDQVLALTPNVQLGSGGDGPAIRGQDSTGALHDLPAFFGGTRPRVTLQVDGRAISYNELAFGATPLWDVSQIEIFRSPQSSTQGRNAIAGAIFVSTADPSIGWTARGRIMADDASTRQVSGMISGPLAGDQLRFRMTADVRRGRASTRITNTADADPNRDDGLVLRAKLLFAPNALPGTRIQLVAAHVAAASPQIEGASAPFRARRDPFATYGVFRSRVDSLTGLLASRLSSSLHLRATLSAGRANIDRHAPPGFGEARNRARDRSAELSLDWRASPNLKMAIGGRLDRTTLGQHIDLSVTPIGLGAFYDRQQSAGIFGEADWTIRSKLMLSLGLRVQHDEQDRDGALTGYLGQIPLPYRGRFSAVLPKAAISYKLTQTVRTGILVQKAYNPGGTTIDLAHAAAQTFAAETLWDYELFVRATSRDERLQLSANLFNEEMTNAQRAIARRIITPAGPVSFAEIVNQPRAYSRGIEVEGRWQLDAKLNVRGGLGLLWTKTTRTVSAADPSLGREFARTPRLSGNLRAEWQPAPNLRLSGAVRHNEGYFSDDFETKSLRVGAATVADARADWTIGRATLFGYARNLFDNFYLTWRFPSVPTRPDLATPGDPREVGIGLDARF